MLKRKKSFVAWSILLSLLVSLVAIENVVAASNQELQVAVVSEEPYGELFTEEDGSVGGYVYELLCEIGLLTGHSYEFVHCTKEEAYDGLDNHRFDLVCGLTEGDAQSKDLNISSLPVGWYPNVMYAKNGEIQEGSVVGVLQENQSELSYTKMTFGTRDEAIEALEDGTVQAIVLPGYTQLEGYVRIGQVDTEYFYIATSQDQSELMEVIDLAFEELISTNVGLLERLTVRYLYGEEADLFYLTQEEQTLMSQLEEVNVLISQDHENVAQMSESLLQDMANTMGINLLLKKDQTDAQSRYLILMIILVFILVCILAVLAGLLYQRNRVLRRYQSKLAEKTDVITEITKDEGLRELRYFTLSTLADRVEAGCKEVEKQSAVEIDIENQFTYPQKLVGDEAKIYLIILGLLKDIIKTNRGIKKVKLVVKELPEMVMGRLELKIQLQYPTMDNYGYYEDDRVRSKDRTTALGMLEILGGRLLRSTDWDYTKETLFFSLEKRHYKEKEEERIKSQQEKIRQAQLEHLEEQRELYNSDQKNLKEELTTSLQGSRILLVDDDEMNLQLEKVILEKAGAVVVCTTSGREAVTLFRKSPDGYYDKIVMDIVMSGMDGYEAARKIRSMRREDAKTVRIVALSANAADEDVKEAIESGMDAHCSKPINKSALFKALNA